MRNGIVVGKGGERKVEDESIVAKRDLKDHSLCGREID